jgi:sugar phosphate isomerase/epimerase
MECIRDCAEHGIKLVVMHAYIGFEKHEPTQMGVDLFGKLVDYAANLGVKIAFENTEGEEYLACLMENFKDKENVGFCWDTGHELCYNRSKDMTHLYGDRLFCTHINDNLGIKDYNGSITYIDDLHLLPFDGIADWNKIAQNLAESPFDGPLTFELNTVSKPGRHENDKYAAMPVECYIAEAYIRACKVASLYLKAKENMK